MMPETGGTRGADHEMGVGFARREGGVIASFFCRGATRSVLTFKRISLTVTLKIRPG